jgi:hypothetical protein
MYTAEPMVLRQIQLFGQTQLRIRALDSPHTLLTTERINLCLSIELVGKPYRAFDNGY